MDSLFLVHLLLLPMETRIKIDGLYRVAVVQKSLCVWLAVNFNFFL